LTVSEKDYDFSEKYRAKFNLVHGGFVMAEKKIGEVVKFFAKPSVAAVHLTEGELQVGDSIKYSGHTTEFVDVVQSMEVDNKPVQKAAAGDSIGLKVSDRVRPGDEVFKIIAD
jgi:translation elongation factor EF-1alpha